MLDDQQAKIVGGWSNSKTVKPYLGTGYLTDNNEDKGRRTVTFTPVIPQTGHYEVRFAYTPQPNRATNVPVTILHADGESTVVVNQRAAPPLAGHFVSLGQFRFEKDGAGYVLVSNEGTDGYVIVDALQVLAADGRAEPPSVVLAGTSIVRKRPPRKRWPSQPIPPIPLIPLIPLIPRPAKLRRSYAGWRPT